MRFFIFSFFFFFLQLNKSSAQSPGGVAATNTMWLRSDVGVTAGAAIVSQWQEISGANVTGNFTVQPLTGTGNIQTGPTVLDAGINFNPYLSFNGSTNSLSSINIFPGTSLVSNINVTVFQVFNLKGGIVWLKWETDQVGTTGRLGFENSAGRIRFDFPKAIPATAGQNVGVTNVLNQHTLSTAYADAALSVNRLNGATDNTLALSTPGNFAAANDKIVIGNENLINLPAQVDMAEVIIYSSTLSAIDRNKIESYLAVKYGFTLNQAAANANNYTSANGTVTWDRAANSGYANNITGIARDDASSLLQKQSKSINPAALITLYNGAYVAGNFPLTNATNGNGFANDGSFLLIGDNAAATTIDQCIFNGKAQRMQRVWKVSETGPLFPVTVSADLGAIPASAVNLVVSSDPSFPPAATVIHPLTTANGKVYVDVTLNHNEYFTYATDTVVLGMVVTQPLCSNPGAGGVTTTVSGGNPPFLYSWSPSGQATASLVNVTGGVYTLTVTQGACQATQQVTLNIPASPAAPVVNAVSVCPGTSATLAIVTPDASLTYDWYASASGGSSLASGVSFVTPVISSATTYYVQSVIGACVSIRTAVPVTITILPAPVANAVTVCSGNTATLTVQNPVGANTYNWYNTASGGTLLGTGTSLNTSALTSPLSFYVEATSGFCVSIRTEVIVSVTVIAAPAANNVTICASASAMLSISSPVGGLTYSWFAAAVGGIALGTGINFNTANLNSNTTFYASGSDGTCSSVRTPFLVTVNTIPPPVAGNVAVCPGNAAMLNVVNPAAGLTYNWYSTATGGVSLAAGTGYTTAPVISPIQYFLEATDGTCNSIRSGVMVSLAPPPDTPRITVTNITGSSITFSWQPVAGAVGYQVSLDGINYSLPSSGSAGTTHIVNGLAHSTTVSISVIAVGPPQGCGNSLPGHKTATTYGDGFYVPGAFTPNGDTRNDVLIPILPGGAILEYFTVFNRWGQQVFTTKLTGAGWDGKWQGLDQPVGAYVWICRYRFNGGKIIDMKGTFTILH